MTVHNDTRGLVRLGMEFGLGGTAKQLVPEVLNRGQENKSWQDKLIER